jgi:hypothetical protein
MRLIGRGRVIRVDTPEYLDVVSRYYQEEEVQSLVQSTGRRGIIMIDVRKVGTSCGYAVPYFDYKGPRPTLINFFSKKDDDQVTEYWRLKNLVSLDGLPGMRHARLGPGWTGTNRTALTIDENESYPGEGSLTGMAKRWPSWVAPRLMDLAMLTTGICIGVLVARRR